MFGLKTEDVIKVYRRMLHIKFLHYTTSCTIDIRGGNRAMLTDGINTSNIFSCGPKEYYPSDVLDADKKGILKELIIVYMVQ
jgi:hypothetical protein